MGKYFDVTKIGILAVTTRDDKDRITSTRFDEFYLTMIEPESEADPALFIQTIENGEITEYIRHFDPNTESNSSFAIFIAAQNTKPMDVDESETYTIGMSRDIPHYMWFPESGKIIQSPEDPTSAYVCVYKNQIEKDITTYAFGCGVDFDGAYNDCKAVKSGIQNAFNQSNKVIVINGNNETGDMEIPEQVIENIIEDAGSEEDTDSDECEVFIPLDMNIDETDFM